MANLFLPLMSGVLPETYHLYIYDRWGNNIFETTNAYKGWDGTNKGDVVMEDIEELAGDLCSALTELAEAAGTAMPSLELPPARVEAPREVAGRKTDVIPMPLGSGSPRGLSGRGAGRAR